MNRIVSVSRKLSLPFTYHRGNLRRLMGHDSHSIAPSGPYAPKHHDHYPNEAYAFGIKPGDASEGWEIITWSTYILSFVAIVLGLSMKENDNFKDWARREALAREVIVENGGEIEFGKVYQNITYSLENIDSIPAPSEE